MKDLDSSELFENGGDYLVCPYCEETVHIGGLVGENQTDCPCCGATFEEISE